ncbi:hypothetical protein B0H14DRAFT_3867763, partial [Mycena olivaceomarginata]
MTGDDLGLDLRTPPNPNQSPSAPTTNANAMLGQKGRSSAAGSRPSISVELPGSAYSDPDLSPAPSGSLHNRLHKHRRRTVDEPLEPILRPVPVPTLERADPDEAPPSVYTTPSLDPHLQTPYGFEVVHREDGADDNQWPFKRARCCLLPPLDGEEEGELIDDEACFFCPPVRAVTGITAAARGQPYQQQNGLASLGRSHSTIRISHSRSSSSRRPHPRPPPPCPRHLFPFTLEQQHITAVEFIVPTLQNIVAIVDPDGSLDLKTIARNAEYNPRPRPSQQRRLARLCCRAVSHAWARLASDNAVWRAFFISRWGVPPSPPIRPSRPSPPPRTSSLTAARMKKLPPLPPDAASPLPLITPPAPTPSWRALYRARLALERRWGPPARALSGHADSVYCLKFSRSHIFTGSRDRAVKVWSVRTGRLLGTFAGGHRGSVLCLKFELALSSSNPGGMGGTLVTGSSDCTVCVWHLWTESAEADLRQLYPSFAERWYGQEDSPTYYVKMVDVPGRLSGKILRLTAQLPDLSASTEINGDGIRPVAFVVQPPPPFDDSEDIRESLADLPIR